MCFMEECNKLHKKKILPGFVWNFLGILTTTLGILGIFLPVLPTTPFLLLAAYCFNRGSSRIRNWFNRNKVISFYIESYRTNAGVPLISKIISIAILWITIFISMYFVDMICVRILLGAVLIGVTIHLLKMKTRKRD